MFVIIEICGGNDREEFNVFSIFHKAHIINSASSHPRVMEIINECEGKIHMLEHQWSQATTNFFEAFKNYDEVGNDQRRIQCLK
ncbi:hypothetical protein Fmac_001681 [Flemingia macrophylla]|uniref:Uncharacterized protein n=1 Tax=Flemingia macrophylla TaxID=520843 RepID=A0ABD1NHS9_9FABA